MVCENPLAEYFSIERRWYFTSTDNRTVATQDSEVSEFPVFSGIDCSETQTELCGYRIHINSVEHTDAGRYVCVAFSGRNRLRRINMYNVTYVLRVYGKTIILLIRPTQRRSVTEERWRFSAASVCQHDNFRTSKHRMMKLGGKCIVEKSRPSSNVGVIAPWVCTVHPR